MKALSTLLLFLALTCQAQLPVVPRVLSTASSGFDPSQANSLVIWLNPTNGLDVSTDGASVTYWTNAVNSHLYTPLTYVFNSGGKPTIIASGGPNSQRILDWPNAYFTATGPVTNWTQPWWFIGVLRSWDKFSNLDSLQTPLESGSGVQTAVARMFIHNGNFTMSTDGVTYLDSGFHYTNRFVCVACCFSNNTSYIYTNGVLAGSGSAGAGTCGNPFYLGSGSGATFVWHGWVGDMMVLCSNATTVADAANIQTWLTNKYAMPDTGTFPTHTFITAQTLGTLRNNFGGRVGVYGPVNYDIYTTFVGRWMVAGNANTHVVGLYSSGGAALATATVTLSTPADYNYARVTDFLTQRAANFFLESTEAGSGDQWYDCNTTVTYYTGLMGVGDQPVANEVGQFGACGGNLRSYVPPNMKFWTPHDL